jgi:hypothetical protein
MNDKRELLIECIAFEADQNLLKEAINNPHQPFRVRGVLQRKGAKNQNGRVYPDDILEREVAKYNQTFVAERRALGELDHAENAIVNLKNVSHNIVSMGWQGDDLIGIVEILTTPSGNILRELFRNGIRLGISSRGLGTLKKGVTEGTSIVGDDSDLLCFDFVSNPSVQGAFMIPMGQVPLAENIVKDLPANRWIRTEEIVRNILTELE